MDCPRSGSIACGLLSAAQLERRSRAPVSDPVCVCARASVRVCASARARLLGTRDAAPRGNQPLIVAQLGDNCLAVHEDSFVCSQPVYLDSVQEH